jgi:shikimate kinase
MNIVLIGFMGSGKSAVAKAISVNKKLRLIDLDAEIERASGKSIPEIFDSEGEAGFRQKEAEECKKASESDNAVISTGGGIVLNWANVLRLKENGKLFWLKASPKELQKRLAKSTSSRPLLKNGFAKAFDLLKVREHLYKKAADVTIETDGKTADQVAKSVLERLEK